MKLLIHDLKKASIFLIAIVLVLAVGVYVVKDGGDSTQTADTPPGSTPPV